MADLVSTTASVSPTEPARITNRRFLQQVLRLAGHYWRCEKCAKVRGMTLLLVVLTIAQVGLTAWSNYWHRALFDALEQHSVQGVILQVAIFALIFTVTIGVTAAHLIVKRWLQIDWRSWLTGQLIDKWMDEGRHYRLLFTPGEHDNPDQRIAEDIRISTEVAINLAHSLIYSIMIMGLFIDILWQVSGSIAVPGTDTQVPGYMVPLAFIYAALGSFIGWTLGRPLVLATNTLQTAEATFRFGLSRARENTETIALMRAESLERSASSSRFQEIVRAWDRQSLAFMGLVSFSTAYGVLLPVFPILVAAPQYISGAMSLGILMQAAQAFQRLTSALSWPVDNIGEIARCRASADRVMSLYESIRRLDANAQTPGVPSIVVKKSERPRLIIEDLCIAEPSGRILLEHFSENIRRGERILITGDSTVTRCFFKVIGGLWPWGCGQITLPTSGEILFISQNAFLPEGTLRQSISYPLPPDRFNTQAIRHALECAGLSWLSSRLEEWDNWEQSLTQQAQQRAGIARILLQRPHWVFLEEATDAFDLKGEKLILEMLRRELPNTTLLNISFRPELKKLYHRMIVLKQIKETRMLFNGHRNNGMISQQ